MAVEDNGKWRKGMQHKKGVPAFRWLSMCCDLVPYRRSEKLLGPSPLHCEFLNMFATLYKNILGSTLGGGLAFLAPGFTETGSAHRQVAAGLQVRSHAALPSFPAYNDVTKSIAALIVPGNPCYDRLHC